MAAPLLPVDLEEARQVFLRLAEEPPPSPLAAAAAVASADLGGGSGTTPTTTSGGSSGTSSSSAAADGPAVVVVERVLSALQLADPAAVAEKRNSRSRAARLAGQWGLMLLDRVAAQRPGRLLEPPVPEGPPGSGSDAETGLRRALEEARREVEELRAAVAAAAAAAATGAGGDNRPKDESEEMQQLRWENLYLSSTVKSMTRATERAVAPAAAASAETGPATNVAPTSELMAMAVSDERALDLLRRGFSRAEENRVVLVEAAAWVRRVFGPQRAAAYGVPWVPESPLVPLDEALEDVDGVVDAFMDSLQTGVVLCDLLQELAGDRSGLRGPVHRECTACSMLAHDNLQLFVAGCRRLGVPDHQLLPVAELMGRSRGPVGAALLALARRTAAWRADLPEIVRLEMAFDGRAEMDAEAFSGAGSSRAPRAPSPEIGDDDASDGLRAAVERLFGDLDLGDESELRRPVWLGRDVLSLPHVGSSRAAVCVCLLRGVLMARHRQSWVELGSLLHEIVRDRMEDAKWREQQRAEPPQPQDGPAAGSVPQKKTVPQLSNDAGAYRDFFYLTALAARMNCQLPAESLPVLSSDRLFGNAVAEGVPFHKFAAWIDTQLTKAYLENLLMGLQRSPSDHLRSQGGLRALRRRNMEQIPPRKTTTVVRPA